MPERTGESKNTFRELTLDELQAVGGGWPQWFLRIAYGNPVATGAGGASIGAGAAVAGAGKPH